LNAHEKHIDEKIKERALKQGELADLGDEIARSARPTVVAFIDLADSTAMKEDRPPEEWLGSVYEFLIRVSDLVKASSGTVVKRIGDEVMATFTKVEQSEAFINAVIEDKALRTQRYKIALDFGKAFHFRFIEGREDDPYGTVVDRCARIAKLATPDTIVCTGDYHDELPPKGTSRYANMGKFPLKGLKEHCTIYMST
jgi:class 3 adenylate cyclase